MLNSEVIKKEIKKAKGKVKEYKYSAEANIVGCLYDNVENVHTMELDISDFSNASWGVLFTIISDLVLKEKKEHLDELTVGLYVENRPKIKELYEKYKGYKTIVELKSMVDSKNLEGYIAENKKWKTVMSLLDNGFLVNLEEAVDYTNQELYDYYDALMNQSFIESDTDEISGTFDLGDGLLELIDELDKGLQVGLPYHNLKILTNETNGVSRGNVTLIGASSGTGKSSFIRSQIITSVIDNDEKMAILLNEEDESKTRAEMLIWVANNVFNYNITKYILRGGKYEADVKEKLINCAKWLNERKDQIIIIPFKRWKVTTAIKIIRKYERMFGVNYFVVDTLKLPTDAEINNTWLVLAQNMVHLYDTVKRTNKNEGSALVCTFQLNKESANKRYYTQNNIGVGKNIIDVASTCIMMRWLYQDEYPEGKHEIKVYELKGKNGGTKIPVTLDVNKKYQVLFITKNRHGATDNYCIVIEVDLSKNIYREVGITTSIVQDF